MKDQKESKDIEGIVDALPLLPSGWKSKKRRWLSALMAKTILTGMAFLIALPHPSLLACACSEVVIGGGAVTSNMEVGYEDGVLKLEQSDIELPGIIPIEVKRTYKSNTTAFGIFGPGWAANHVYSMEETEGDIKVSFPGSLKTFPQANAYISKTSAYVVGYSAPEEITVKDKEGQTWIFNGNDRTLKKTIDRNGNEVNYTWKIITKQVGVDGASNPITTDIFCPLTVTYPDGRQLLFTYDTSGNEQYLCRSIASPSGFTVGYTYTDGLLTGISKSNGQALHYEYHKITDPYKTVGWLKKITYANAAEVHIAYNGAYASSSEPLRVTSVTGPEGYNHTYSYQESEDGRELITTQTDSLDRSTVYVNKRNLDGTQQLIVTNGLGGVIQKDSDAQGRLISVMDARGKVTHHTYDTGNSNALATRNLLTQTNALGKTWNYTWSNDGNMTKVKDPLDQGVEMTYDSKGNLLTLKNGLNQTVYQKTYTSRGQLAIVKDGLDYVFAFSHDTNGFINKIIDAASKEWQFLYDNAGNILETENPLGRKWTTTYNGFYKPATFTDALLNTTVYTYDDMANLNKIEDANGNEIEWTYDLLQRVSGIKDALGNSIIFTYDSESNLTKLTDPLQREYVYTFDAINQTKSFGFPGGSQESYDYDAAGNLTKITNRAGNKVAFSYDDANRLAQRIYEDISGPQPTFNYNYDDADRMTSIIRTSGTVADSIISISYNSANQVASITAEGRTIGYTYDIAQQLSQIDYPSGEIVKYYYDSRGMLDAIKSGSDAVVVSYIKDDAGRLTKCVHSNGLETIYTWNDANWLIKLELREIANPTNIIQSFEYGYDAVGNRLWTKTSDGRGDVFQYDVTYQVIGVKFNVDDPTVGYDAATNATRIVTYQYDAVGNRISVNENGSPTSYTINPLNQYTQVGGNSGYTYNARGDLSGDGTWTYGYDREGRLISANKVGTTVTYTYDAAGRRIEKDVNGVITKYTYNGYDLIEERDGSNVVTAKYIYESGIDRPVKVINSTGEYYFHRDVLNNVIALTDASGVVVERYSYDAFGAPMITDRLGALKSSPMTPYLFTGREFDHETGLYHYRTRAFSPILGRFLQPDSIAFVGKDINLYRYARNNPLNNIDPDGRVWGNIIGGIVGGIAGGITSMANQVMRGEPCLNWGDVAESAFLGAVTGAVAPTTSITQAGALIGAGLTGGFAAGVYNNAKGNNSQNTPNPPMGTRLW